MKILLKSPALFTKARASGFDASLVQPFSSSKEKEIRSLPGIPRCVL